MVTTERAPAPADLETGNLEANKAVVHSFITEIFGQQNLAAIDELAAEDFTPHTWGQTPPGREALRTATQRAGAGVSEARFDIHLLVAEDDIVAAYLSSSAVHTGDFMGLPATGKRYSIDEMHFFRLRNGQVTEHWHVFDKGDLLRQLAPDDSSTGTTEARPEGAST